MYNDDNSTYKHNLPREQKAIKYEANMICYDSRDPQKQDAQSKKQRETDDKRDKNPPKGGRISVIPNGAANEEAMRQRD